ncbi:DUF4405 domain-containing protein [Jiella sp. M17.18]|uniref:DUF4405 domain-containing protein n=1 Tax=Jiella sp. M17.18 TaxID=3234247 RepID=UPI0034DE48B5
MQPLVQRYATPLITGFFLVSLVSGVLIFFHWGPGFFHSMHEWLSMVLILPFVLHIWRNWRAFSNYFRRPPMLAALAVSLVAAALFVVPTGSSATRERGGPPQFALAETVLSGSAAGFAGLVGQPADAVVASLQKAGFPAADATTPLRAVAQHSGRSERELMTVLVQRVPGAPAN